LGNGVDLGMFKKDKSGAAEFRRRHGIPEAAKVMVFVGSLSRQKNVVFLLYALAEILKIRKDVFLLLVGAGDYEKDLRKISAELNLNENIKFIGFVPHERVAPYYNMSDVFVMASFSEIMPLVILEAEACGLPAVVLDEAAFHDTISSGENGYLVKEEKPGLFADHVLKLLGDEEVYNKFSEAALRTAEKFSIDNQTKKLLEVYQSLIR
jgi:glycosyltransferase involved in cell wall biosynthesis